MKTNLTDLEKHAFAEMLKNNGADDKNTPLVFTVTKDSIQIDNADTFKMPEDMIEYRKRGILYSRAWISKDKKTWMFKELLGNVDQSFFRFLNGMSDQLEAFSEYEGECKYSLGYYIAEESNITVLTEEPNLRSRMLTFFKDVYETPAEAYYVMFNMLTENRRAYKTIIKPNGVNFAYKYTEIGHDLHAFISDDCEVLIQKRSEDVSEGFIEFLFKLQEVIKRYKDTKSSYDGTFKILEHTWYNRIDDDDNEVNEIIDVDVDINNIIVAFVIIVLAPVHHTIDGRVICTLKRFYGKDLRSVEFRGNTMDTNGNMEFHSIKRYILSYNSALDSYCLRE